MYNPVGVRVAIYNVARTDDVLHPNPLKQPYGPPEARPIAVDVGILFIRVVLSKDLLPVPPLLARAMEQAVEVGSTAASALTVVHQVVLVSSASP
jgi:hypothetical protein